MSKCYLSSSAIQSKREMLRELIETKKKQGVIECREEGEEKLHEEEKEKDR